MGSTSNTDSTSEELDELAVRLLNLMNQYIVCKTIIENHVRSGCLDLAKARYIKGNRNISSLQLPSEDAVGVTAKFRVLSKTSSPDDAANFTGIKTEIEDLTKGLKTIALDGDAERVTRFSNDALKWFGILVPQDLRNSMKVFEKCLDIVIECSNVQSELIYVMDKYDACKKNLCNP